MNHAQAPGNRKRGAPGWVLKEVRIGGGYPGCLGLNTRRVVFLVEGWGFLRMLAEGNTLYIQTEANYPLAGAHGPELSRS